MMSKKILFASLSITSLFLGLGISYCATQSMVDKKVDTEKTALNINKKDIKPSANKKMKIVKAEPKSTKDMLNDSWSKTMTDNSTAVDIAVFDNKTQQTYTFSANNNDVHFITASIVKTSFLVQTLHNHELNDNDKELAEKMIVHSDNDATDTFSHNLGASGDCHELFSKLVMNNTHMGATWGQTTTTANDQLKLMNDIAYKHYYINADQSNYVLSLMNNVEDSQKWGVSQGVDDAKSVSLKNGWLVINNQATVNSIGHVVDEKHDYTIAILTRADSQEFGESEDLIGALASRTYDLLTAN